MTTNHGICLTKTVVTDGKMVAGATCQICHATLTYGDETVAIHAKGYYLGPCHATCATTENLHGLVTADRALLTERLADAEREYLKEKAYAEDRIALLDAVRYFDADGNELYTG